MTVKSVTIELDYDGVGQLLRSPEVAADLRRRADAVSARVTARGIKVGSLKKGADDVPLPVTVEQSTSNRARAVVIIDHPAGLSVESKYRILVRSLTAARR